MTKLALITTIALSGSFSWAYRDGVYTCKNLETVPNNVYKIETVEIRPGLSLPYVEATRHYRGQGQSVHQATVRGLATQAHLTLGDEPTELLSVGAIRLEFRGDTMINCKAP